MIRANLHEQLIAALGHQQLCFTLFSISWVYISKQVKSDLEAALRSIKAIKPRIIKKSLLEANGIQHFDKDIRRMKRDELAASFGAKSSGRILLTRLIKNIIWQAYERINAKTAPLIKGNIRTFWYLWVKPTLAHFPDEDEAKSDPYETMIKIFAEMVLDLKLFKYEEFDFSDENWENRRIGTTRPEVLVFAEKAGWIRFLRELHEELGVSILALSGYPSALTSEYTARDVGATLNGKEPVRLIGIVDYDPAGDLIANSFQQQLWAVGFPKTILTTVIDPKHYSEDEIDIFKFPLPKSERTKLTKWLKQTGGINGKAYGLESESMPLDRLKELINELVLSPARGKRKK